MKDGNQNCMEAEASGYIKQDKLDAQFKTAHKIILIAHDGHWWEFL